MTARCCLVLAVLGGCAYDASDDVIWRGTIQDGGAPASFLGFDPQPQQGFQFGGGIEAEGYLDAPDGKLLVFVALHFADDDFVRAESMAFPIVLTIQDSFSSQETGMGMDLVEQPASKADSGDARANQVFHHEFAQHQTGTASGTFTVSACDYTSFMDGRLQATVMDPSRGNIARTVDLEVHYDAK